MKQLLPLMTVPVMAGSALAQTIGGFGDLELQSTLNSPGTETGFGTRMAVGEDVSGDGSNDYAVLSADASGSVARVFDGQSNALLLTIPAGNGLERGSVGLPGDLNGDGVGDVLVGDTLNDRVDAYSGADGSLIYTVLGNGKDFGTDLVNAGDFNNDGVNDWVAGGEGSMRMYSGIDGSLMTTFGDISGTAYGDRIANVGDFTGDGFNDFVGVDSPRGAMTFNGVTGMMIRHAPGDATDVCAIGDWNADGYNDYAVLYNRGRGEVYAFYGPLDVTAKIWVAPNDSWMTNSLEAVGDLSGDGLTELMAGSSTCDPNNNLIDQHGDYTILTSDYFQWSPAVYGGNGDQLASDIVNLGDNDRDGYDTILVSAAQRGPAAPGNGYVQILDGELQPGMVASSNTISGSAGGTLTYDIQFPPTYNGWWWHFVASLSLGVTDAGGVLVPLVYDSVFQMTHAEQYPPYVNNGVGMINHLGQGQVTMTPAPGEMAGIVGMTIYTASVVYLKGSGGNINRVAYSSIAVPLTITP